MRSYPFTNAYRASDRVSQFLIREVQYGAGRSQDCQAARNAWPSRCGISKACPRAR
ncbi:MAG TPA: nucleotide kinase domain-containing protein [Methyloceanibacter sp.]|nr:nucleotide kinase domain-containing protein [Methyloceanibacter sp.]